MKLIMLLTKDNLTKYDIKYDIKHNMKYDIKYNTNL